MKGRHKQIAVTAAKCINAWRRLPCRSFWIPAVVLFAVASRSAPNEGQESSKATDDRIGQIYLQAQEANRLGDYRGAAQKYRAILSLRPDDLKARVNLGLMEHLSEEYAEAIRQFEIVIDREPQLFVANLFLGLDLLELHQPRRALRYLENAEGLKPNDLEPALQLGRAHADLHQFREANEWYLRATLVNPKSAEAWYGLGVTFLNLARAASDGLAREGQGSVYARRLYAESLEERGWLRDAVSAYQKVLLSTSAPPCVHAELGFAYLVQGDEKLIPEAAQQFDLALIGDKGCLLARLGKARIDSQRNDVAKALMLLKEIWDVDSNFLKVNATRLWQGLDSETMDNLEITIKTSPPIPSAKPFITFLTTKIEQSRKQGSDLFIRGNDTATGNLEAEAGPPPLATSNATPAQLYAEGHYASCAQKLKARLHQASRDDLLLLASCSHDSGEYHLSLDAAYQLLTQDAHSLPALYWQARADQKLGITALTRAAFADPNSPRIHLLVAEAYREEERFTEAEAEYNSALQLDSNYVPALVGLAMVYWQQHRYDEAIQDLNTALALRPGDPESSYIMGDILVNRHQFAQAFPYLNAALSGKSAILPRVHALLGKAYAAQGKLAEAVIEMKQSLDDDTDGAYHYQLYRLYKKLGNEEAGKTALQESESLRKRRNAIGADTVTAPP
jgi:tetratricopeptide (TPR) repeat protein